MVASTTPSTSPAANPVEQQKLKENTKMSNSSNEWHVGVNWPGGVKGKTTDAAKQIWIAAANAGLEHGKQSSNVSEKYKKLPADIQKEKNWRFNYIPHLVQLGELVASSDVEVAQAIARAGLQKTQEMFKYNNVNTNESYNSLSELYDLSSKKSLVDLESDYFTTKIVKGEQKTDQGPKVSLPYKGAALQDMALQEQLKVWDEYGTSEKDVTQKISDVIPKVNAGDLHGKWFVLLGAGSELGPFEFLLKHGANVVAIRTKKEKEWEKMEQFAKRTKGTLYIPQRSGVSGCDIMGETLQIRNWIAQTIVNHATDNGDKKLDITIGMYTYLDSEAHVRVTLGCDVIQETLENFFCKHVKSQSDNKLVEKLRERFTEFSCRLAYIGSSAVSTVISQAMHESIIPNREKSPLWIRMCGAPLPRTSVISSACGETLYLRHGYVNAQGPNYALAKMLQVWRGMLALQVPSFNNGPPSKTYSVTHNPTMKAMMESMNSMVPLETQDPDTASTMMALLLASDVLLASPKTGEKHPFARTNGGAFHGGDLRAGFDVEGSTVLSAGLYVKGKYF